jgi:FolB domain-containing protein
MDCISLERIGVQTRIGVTAAERKKEQLIEVSIDVLSSTLPVAVSDDVTKGIDYALITEAILECAKTERKTIERFAEDIAAMILYKFEPKGGVKVTVTKKPDLPLESVRITIARP